MSKGSPVIRARVERDLYAQIQEAIRRANATTAEEPYSESSWVRKCILDRLAHLERAGRQRRTGKRGSTSSAVPIVDRPLPDPVMGSVEGQP